jgi:hypothetical protein
MSIKMSMERAWRMPSITLITRNFAHPILEYPDNDAEVVEG